MDGFSLDLLKELTEAPGLSGYEDAVREIVRRHTQPLGELSYDRLGSIICKKAGKTAAPRIMIPGHLDEIGFVVNGITADGFLRFSPLGGWWDQVIQAQRVVVKTRKGDRLGMVAATPPHLLKPEMKDKVVKREDMFIDVGAANKREAEAKLGIRAGDPVVPICPFTPMHNPKYLMGKAFDDRVGVAILIDVLRRLQKIPHPNTVFGAGTVQEEVGLRGAETAADVIHPDLAIVVDVGPAADGPDSKSEVKDQGRLGKGPQICFFDAGMIPNLRLRDFMADLALEKKIPYQLTMMERGATDGHAIHLHGIGVPTIYIGIPTRYIHSHAGILHADDYDNAVKLIVEALKRLDAKTVRKFSP